MENPPDQSGAGEATKFAPGLPGALAAASETVSALVARVTVGASIVTTVLMFTCMILQIIFRYALSAPLSWSEEASVFLFIWTMLLLASLGVREKFHVRLDLMFIVLPEGRARNGLETGITLAIAAFGAIMVMTGSEMAELVWNNTSAAIRYPVQALYLAVPVSGALMVVHAVAQLLAQAAGRRS
ncbi:MAG: TRAP transporter small permease [Alphaproteobacteria bacterium]